MKMDFETDATELKLDRSNWSLVKFGDVAIQQKESVDRENTEITRYVKGEHMYSEDLHLRNWGELKDEYLGPAFIRKFDEGDILYGSRRTYLRKVCIAPFTGITANTTFVIKANEDLIDKRLLPFVMLSEGFSAHSIRNSKGSVNPYVNWKDIADYEFLLPPKDQQAYLAELLWVMDDVVDKCRAHKAKCENIYISKREFDFFVQDNNGNFKEHSLLKRDVNKNIEFLTLGDCLEDIKYGTSAKNNLEGKGEKIVGIPNVVNERLSLDNCAYVELSEKEFQNTKLIPGDIVIVRTNGNPEYTGRCALINTGDVMVYASYLIKISPRKKLYNPDFLVRYLQTKTIRRFFRRHATSTAGNYNINTETIKKIPVPQVPIEDQEELVNMLRIIEKTYDQASERLNRSKSLQKCLINQVF